MTGLELLKQQAEAIQNIINEMEDIKEKIMFKIDKLEEEENGKK